MSEKKWIDWSDDCPSCGDGTQVCTDAEQDNISPVAYDGDAAKCNSCKWEGSVSVDGDQDGIGRATLTDGNIEQLDDMVNDPL